MKDYSSDLLNAQLKVIFEMLQIVIDNMEIRTNALGFDFSYAQELFKTND